MTFPIWWESHSIFHGSSHHQADDQDSPHLIHPSRKKKCPALTRFLFGPKKIHSILIPKNLKTAIFCFGDFRLVYHNFWILTIFWGPFFARDLLFPILCAILLVLHPPCWPISRDRSLGNTRRAVAVFGGLGTPNKRNLLLRRLRWGLLSLSNRLICVHYIICVCVCSIA